MVAVNYQNPPTMSPTLCFPGPWRYFEKPKTPIAIWVQVSYMVVYYHCKPLLEQNSKVASTEEHPGAEPSADVEVMFSGVVLSSIGFVATDG